LNERSRNGGIDEVALPRGDGRLWLCGKHLVGPDVEAVLERTGASVVVCLTEGHELSSRYPDYLEWLVANRGGKAMFTPMPDLHATVDDIALIVDGIRTRVDAGDGVVLHCGAGIGRAGTIAAAVLVSMGVSLDDALATVLSSRPTAGPQSVEQEIALSEYAERIT
jgi:protein-tyrosine phosphatase